MKKHDFLICYDIKDVKRLQALYRFVSKFAIPVQYSVFYFNNNAEFIELLTEPINDIIKQDEDDIRIYRINMKKKFITLGKHIIAPGVTISGLFD